MGWGVSQDGTGQYYIHQYEVTHGFLSHGEDLLYCIVRSTKLSNKCCFSLVMFSSCFSLTGWYEGERVSDGQLGWLPASYTYELQNEHVRARNLKARYKLIQAAAKMMK